MTKMQLLPKTTDCDRRQRCYYLADHLHVVVVVVVAMTTTNVKWMNPVELAVNLY